MRAKTLELIGELVKLATLLERDDEHHWSGWMLRAKARLENSDYSGIEYLLSAFAGAGSFNDYVAGQANVEGRFVWKPGYTKLNEEIDILRSKVWELATDLKLKYELSSL